MRIAGLYDVVGEAYPSAVVEVNRAIAHGRAFGPAAGMAVLERVPDASALAGTALLPSVRGDLLERLGDHFEAAIAFREAAAAIRNEAERRLLLARAATNAQPSASRYP